MNLSKDGRHASDPSTIPIRLAVPTNVAAKALGCDASRVRKLVSRGYLEGFKDGASTRVFVDSLSAYQQHKPAGRPTPNEAAPNASVAKRQTSTMSDNHRLAMRSLQALGLIKDDKR